MVPNISYVGAHPSNYWRGRNGITPIAISNHVQLGNNAGTTKAFLTAGFGASANYGVGEDGGILCFVKPEDTAWANGPIRSPNLPAVPWIKTLCIDKGINPNRLTISIEWAGRHKGGRWITLADGTSTIERGSITEFWTPTPKQYAAGLSLVDWLCATYSIQRDRAHITRHSDYDSIKKWFCCDGKGYQPNTPGGFPMAQFIADLGGKLW